MTYKRTMGKIENIKKKINDLARIKKALEHLAGTCYGHGSFSECPILDAMNFHDEA